MNTFGYKLSRITSYLQTGKINECEAMEQLRKVVAKELSDDDILLQNIDTEQANYHVSAPDEDLLKFARAVLKAARG